MRCSRRVPYEFDSGLWLYSVERCTVEGFKLVRGMGEAGVDAG